ncbi:MAG: glycosyltransferase family 4 protein [Verrucomicrobiota bacterium]|nr:glycosyltransferase family 4 protein [Verrucomicrobiota bacterium]
MRIAIFNTVQLETAGGMEHFCIQTAKHLSGLKGVQADCVTMDSAFNIRYGKLHSAYFLRKFDPSIINRESRKSIEVRLGRGHYFKCSNFNELTKILRQYDLIYSRNEITEAFILQNLVGYHRIPPVIFGCHCPHQYIGANTLHSRLHNQLYSSPIYTHLAKRAAGFHTISKSDTQAIQQQFEHHPVEQVPNPFDSIGYANRASKITMPFPLHKKDYNILWAGRLTEQKGVAQLCELIDLVNRTHDKQVAWHICGDGELKGMISSAATKHHNVYPHGHIDRESMPGTYANADLFISTSQWGETYAYTPREANSLGLPVVSYDISGYNEIIDNGINGKLAKSLNEFTEIVKWFADGNKLQSNIKKHIQNKTDAAPAYQQLLHFFHRCL